MPHPLLNKAGIAARMLALKLLVSVLSILTITTVGAAAGGLADLLLTAIGFAHLPLMIVGGALAFGHQIWKESA